MTHGRIALLAAALALGAGCNKKAPAAVSRADCEHVLAHLTVLEKDEVSKPISKYHPSGGDGKEAFLAKCPKVLSVKEADCYQRATSVASADDCLHRGELDARIGGAVAVPGGLAVPPMTRQDQALAELTAARDRTCACKDFACAEAVQKEMEPLQRKYGDLKGDKAFEARVEPIFEQLVDCYDKLEDPDQPGDGDALGELKTLRARACACADKPCADVVMRELGELGIRYKDHKGSDAQMAQAAELAGQLMECIAKTEAGPMTFEQPTPEPPAPPAHGPIGIAGCDDYVAKMEAYVRCDRVPQAARDAARQGIEAMRQAWGDTTTMSETSRQAAGDGCKAASAAIVEAAEAMGCTL